MNLKPGTKEFLHHAATALAVLSLPLLLSGNNDIGPSLAILALVARLLSKDCE